jgi:hypothetical protein
MVMEIVLFIIIENKLLMMMMMIIMTILPFSSLYFLSLSPLLESKDAMDVFHAKTGLLSGTVHD